MEASNLKMYIAVREEVPAHMVPVCVAHAMIGAYKSLYLFRNYDKAWELFDDWSLWSYKKVVVKVNSKEWDKLKSLPDIYLGHENSTLDGESCVAVISPRYDVPNVLKFAKMWKP